MRHTITISSISRHGVTSAIFFFLLLYSCGLFAQLVPFAQVGTPIGVATDRNGNVLISHDHINGTLISKFTPQGVYLGSGLIGAGFLDIQALGSLAPIPSTGDMLLLCVDGRIMKVNPETLESSLWLDIRNLQVQTNAIYDVYTLETGSFSGQIQTHNARFGDMAVYEKSDTLELYITGLSYAQVYPFVMRIRVLAERITEATVLMSSTADFVTIDRQSPRETRGIAVNRAGIVLTSLPHSVPYTGGPTHLAAFDVLYSFPASLTPSVGVTETDSPRLLFQETTDVYSSGMTTDTTGNFYVVTNAAGSAALQSGGQGTFILLPADLSQATAISGAGSLNSFYDVALSPDGLTAYTGVNLPGSTLDLVAALPLDNARPDRTIPTPEASNTAPEVKSTPADKSLATSQVSVFPVPAIDWITIQYRSRTDTESVTASVYNMLGKELLTARLAKVDNDWQTQLNVSQLASGKYLIKIKAEGEQAEHTSPFLKQ